MKRFLGLIAFLCITQFTFSQSSDKDKITATLNNYIQGTSYSNPSQISKAFHETANLYLSKKDQDLWIVPSKEYTSWFKNTGKFTGRLGSIIAIDIENDIATAKAEILIPKSDFRFIDLFLLKRFDQEWKIISKTATRTPSNKKGNRILFIVSNSRFYGASTIKNGNSFSEIVEAYDVYQNHGYTIDFMSPQGGAVPLVYMNMSDPIQERYLYDADFMYRLKYTKSPQEIDAKQYKAVYYVGGGGVLYEVPDHAPLQKVVMDIYENQNGIISSVCHGYAGITNLKTKDGQYLVKGKRVNGYPHAFENQKRPYYAHFPFNIQQTIIDHGGIYERGEKNKPFVIVDQNLVTGQNYLSASLVAKKVIELIEK